MSYGNKRDNQSWGSSDPFNSSDNQGNQGTFEDRDQSQNMPGSDLPSQTGQRDWQSQQARQGQQGSRSQGYDDSQSSQGFQSGLRSQYGAGQGGDLGYTGYPGNTTSADTFGAGGGGLGSSGARGRDDWRSSGSAGTDDDNWRASSGASSGYGQGDFGNDDFNQEGVGRTKPSIGDRLKGDAEKFAGKMTGNPSMVQRGQQRKTGESDF